MGAIPIAPTFLFFWLPNVDLSVIILMNTSLRGYDCRRCYGNFLERKIEMNKKSVWRKIVLGIPTVMLVVIATAFTWDFASTSINAFSTPQVKPRSAGYYSPQGSYNKSLNVAHLVSYSVAASLLVASTGLATRMMRDEK